MSDLYQLATPLVVLGLLIVAAMNLSSPTALALFIASFWIFTGMWAR